MELAIAQALQALVSDSGKVFSVQVQDLHFVGDAGLSMTLQTHASTPPDEVLGF